MEFTSCTGNWGGSAAVVVRDFHMMRCCFSISRCNNRGIAVYSGTNGAWMHFESSNFWDCSKSGGVIFGFRLSPYELIDDNFSDSVHGLWGAIADHKSMIIQ